MNSQRWSQVNAAISKICFHVRIKTNFLHSFRYCCPLGQIFVDVNGAKKCSNPSTEAAPISWNSGSGWEENENLLLIPKVQSLTCPSNVKSPSGVAPTTEDYYEYK